MSRQAKPPANTTPSKVASDAFAENLAWRTQQVQALKQDVAAADRGEFASDDEIEQFFNDRASE